MRYSYENWSELTGGKRFLTFDVKTSAVFNDNLTQIILRMEPSLIHELEHSPAAGILQGTTSTWKQHNVLVWDYPECAALRRTIADCVRVYAGEFKLARVPSYIQCWCNVLRAGDKFECHDHGAPISGVYYPDGMRSEEEHGLTCYEVDGAPDEWMEVTPKRGMLNLFQGDLSHFVTEYKGVKPRISVAFDVLFEAMAGHLFIPLEDG
jgi:hypothetical protein